MQRNSRDRLPYQAAGQCTSSALTAILRVIPFKWSLLVDIVAFRRIETLVEEQSELDESFIAVYKRLQTLSLSLPDFIVHTKSRKAGGFQMIARSVRTADSVTAFRGRIRAASLGQTLRRRFGVFQFEVRISNRMTDKLGGSTNSTACF